MMKNDRKRMKNQLDIPMDVIGELLLFLPVKTLARFKCVSKQWRAIICSPRFTSMHNSMSAHATKLIYLIVKNRAIFSWHTFFDEENPKSLLSFLPNQYVSFQGSCNGLVLLATRTVRPPGKIRPNFIYADHSLIIWNPRTGKQKPVGICQDFTPSSTHSYGFGSCKVDGGTVDDYKVVAYLLRFPFNEPPPVYVYTLSTHSWKRVVVHTASTSASCNDPDWINTSVVINGVMFMVGRNYSAAHYYQRVIMSFDLQRQVSRDIALPKGSDLIDKDIKWTVGNYRRRFLSLVSHKLGSTLLSAWVLDKEYCAGGVDELCWKKLFVVSVAPTLVLTNYFGSRVSMKETCDSSHWVFDTESQQWIQVGNNLKDHPLKAIAYNESLGTSLDETWW